MTWSMISNVRSKFVARNSPSSVLIVCSTIIRVTYSSDEESSGLATTARTLQENLSAVQLTTRRCLDCLASHECTSPVFFLARVNLHLLIMVFRHEGRTCATLEPGDRPYNVPRMEQRQNTCVLLLLLKPLFFPQATSKYVQFRGCCWRATEMLD